MGLPIDWSFVQKNPSARFVYPWLEKKFWYREIPLQTIIPPIGAEETTEKRAHPFLAQVKMTELYSGLHCWETEIDLYRFPTLKDHALIQGGAVMPGTAYLEMAFAMAMDKFVDVACIELTDVKLLNLLTLPETQVRQLRLRFQKEDKIDKAQFYITSLQNDQSEITLSSGNISLDLLHRREHYEGKGITIVETFSNTLINQPKNCAYILLYIAVVFVVLLLLVYFMCY